jgi:hypothetical protein
VEVQLTVGFEIFGAAWVLIGVSIVAAVTALRSMDLL